MRSNQTEVTLFSYLLYLIDFIEFGCQIKNKLCLKIGLVPPFLKNKLIADVYVSTQYGTSIQQVGELSDGFAIDSGQTSLFLGCVCLRRGLNYLICLILVRYSQFRLIFSSRPSFL